MRAIEIYGKRIRDYLAYINLKKIDDGDLARTMVRAARKVEREQGLVDDDLLGIMYGQPTDDDGFDLYEARDRTEIDQIKAKTTQDLAGAVKSLDED